MERLLARGPDLLAEMKWAVGHPASGPRKRRPAWLKGIIRRALSDGFMQPFSDLGSLAQSMSLQGEVRGGAIVAAKFLEPTKENILPEEKAFPELRKLRQGIWSMVIGAVENEATRAKKSGKVAKKKKRTAKETVDYLQGVGRGATKATAVEAPFESQAIVTQLAQTIWLSWEEVEQARNRRDLHQWLTEDQKIKCEFATLEKLCRQVGLKLAPRGRAKKIRPLKTKP